MHRTCLNYRKDIAFFLVFDAPLWQTLRSRNSINLSQERCNITHDIYPLQTTAGKRWSREWDLPCTGCLKSLYPKVNANISEIRNVRYMKMLTFIMDKVNFAMNVKNDFSTVCARSADHLL